MANTGVETLDSYLMNSVIAPVASARWASVADASWTLNLAQVSRTPVSWKIKSSEINMHNVWKILLDLSHPSRGFQRWDE